MENESIRNVQDVARAAAFAAMVQSGAQRGPMLDLVAANDNPLDDTDADLDRQIVELERAGRHAAWRRTVMALVGLVGVGRPPLGAVA